MGAVSKRVARSGLCFLWLVGLGSGALAGMVEGGVTADGSPVAGAMVTAKALESGVETTVFSAGDGAYRIDRLTPGDYELTARAPGRRAPRRSASIAQGSVEPVSFDLQRDPEFRKAVSSAGWLDLLPDGDMKREFVLNCGSCHEISYGRVMREGKPRSAAEWRSAIALMRAIDVYGLTPPDFDDDHYAEWLAENLSAAAIDGLRPGPLANGPALAARVTEYPVPQTPSLPHDLVVGADGRIWVTAFYNNALWALDPDTGKMQSFAVNPTPDIMGQVRALTFGPTGMLWVLLGGTESLVRLDPRDGTIQSFSVGMYPHSIEIDSQGRLWFNDYLSASKRIGHLDPNSGTVVVYEIPGVALRPSEGLPLLYGLQVDREDVVWGTMLAANKLFRFDMSTQESRLFEMPSANSGPRRPGLGPDGAIWIPEFNTGTLTRFDPLSEEFTRYPLGRSTLGPYDVAVDQKNGAVWVAAALGSALIRYDPATGRRDVYPFPTEPGYPRHIAIDPRTGDVWTTYSSMPDAVPKIVRLETAGGSD